VVGHKDKSGTGRWTRFGFGLQVLFALVLAIGACMLAVHLSEWRRARWRADFTASGSNTLDPQTMEILEGLDERVKIDIFFRTASTEHMRLSTDQAQQLTNELLSVAKNLLPEKLEIEAHNLLDLAATEKRMQELSLTEVQSVVVSLGERREVLRLYTDLAEFDYGSENPRSPRPATLHKYRGEEAFAEALKKVSSGDSPRIYFSAGHGEADPNGSEARDLGQLTTELTRQGFIVDTWEGAVDGPVPDDCDLLAIVAPEQPFTDREREYVSTWVDAGGRLLGAAERDFSDEEGSVGRMLRRYGMILKRGLVCMPVLDYLGNPTEGLPECMDFRVSDRHMNSSHEITQPLVERDRKLRFVYSRSFDYGGPPEGGLLLELVSSPAESWRDMPDANFTLDFSLDNNRETTGRFRLVMVSTFPVVNQAGEPAELLDSEGLAREARVIGIASPFFMANNAFSTNRDFLLNAFNWLAERDFRVGVASRDPERSLVDITRGADMAVIFHSTLWGLPAVFGLLGVVTFLRRRR